MLMRLICWMKKLKADKEKVVDCLSSIQGHPVMWLMKAVTVCHLAVYFWPSYKITVDYYRAAKLKLFLMKTWFQISIRLSPRWFQLHENQSNIEEDKNDHSLMNMYKKDT